MTTTSAIVTLTKRSETGNDPERKHERNEEMKWKGNMKESGNTL